MFLGWKQRPDTAFANANASAKTRKQEVELTSHAPAILASTAGRFHPVLRQDTLHAQQQQQPADTPHTFARNQGRRGARSC